MRWNLHSNACDVLGLGPRTAGILATVGVRTVASLLAVSAESIARRVGDSSITAAVLASWQAEAQLILDFPELPAEAARLLGATGFHSAQQIRSSTPTELLAELEVAQQQKRWLALDNELADRCNRQRMDHACSIARKISRGVVLAVVATQPPYFRSCTRENTTLAKRSSSIRFME